MVEKTQRQKIAAAQEALKFINQETRLGVGSGSTVHCFIDLLAQNGGKAKCFAPSSEQTARRLEAAGFVCQPEALELDLYVDGADEVDDNRQMLKGGGGAHTREKILATSARRFVCMVSADKKVARLGKFPLAVEVLPMARSFVARKLAALGGNPKWREGFVTDNGNWILDVAGLDLTAAAQMEAAINNIPGVMENGIFSHRRADVVIVADGADGEQITILE